MLRTDIAKPPLNPICGEAISLILSEHCGIAELMNELLLAGALPSWLFFTILTALFIVKIYLGKKKRDQQQKKSQEQ